MAASTRAVNSTGLSMPKWQIALAIGAPVALGLGVWYYRSNKAVKKVSKDDVNEAPNGTATTATVQSQIEGDKIVASNSSSLQSGESPPVSHTVPAPAETVQDPYKQSQVFKNKGNKYFKEGKFADAIKCYQQAIDLCPKTKVQDVSTFHQNRAAAYEQLKNYDAVIKDCTAALQYNSKYTKALHRRAKAYEISKQLENCLEDITAVCILEAFQNQPSLLMADRVLKELGKQHAKEAMAHRIPVVPSKHFVNTFMCSFSEDPVFNLVKNQSDELQSLDSKRTGFAEAVVNLKLNNYDDIITLCTEEVEAESGDATTKQLAKLLRGTFHLLLGEHDKAVADFTAVFDDKETDAKLRVNALVKRATLLMQQGAPEESLHDLQMAAELGPDNSDVFHHRGQVYMLLDKPAEAMSDFAKAVALNSNFPIALGQKLYTDYRLAVSLGDAAKMQDAMQAFEEAIRKFPDCPECYLLYAQVLSDQQDFKKADDFFKKALEVDPQNATAYVHRGLLQLQWKGDVSATKLIEEAIHLDPKCEFAYETLGRIEIQRGNLTRAIELFDMAIPLSKTEVEIAHLFSLKDATLAQVKVAEKLGVTLPSP